MPLFDSIGHFLRRPYSFLFLKKIRFTILGLGGYRILGVGNPLLDLTVNGDAELLKKYKLEANNAVLANMFQKSMYKHLMKNYNVQLSAGGSVQNSLRVCQWILKTPHTCVFMGSVGTDKYSEMLKETAENDGVKVIYQYQKKIPTGTCAAIITTHEGNKRSLCANLAAAEKFTIQHILKPENFKIVEKVEMYYISGFFITVSPETIYKIGEVASTQNKVFCMNLSAPFICTKYKETLIKSLFYADIVFGNVTEAQAIAKGKFNTNSMKEIAIEISNLPKSNQKRKRIVVITNGPLPVLYVKDNEVKEVAVPPVPDEIITDTNGAGDAFTGGFISQFLIGKDIEKCIQCGNWAASIVIQNNGCTYNKDLTYSG
ncbi:adenosine kinase, putative [Pediculus humanus corporis]|uniref:Adenosine kinase n=1 Tax=Pediculus humanus subsp. corporis TaxID=121224 RepID=E0VE01_PEDHC|nr:adenosine kinase, putative [Pediculus humanus corporis]EEB11607.1 adenosine kinase, putative [Pediculus humanus corporis]